MSDSHTVTTTLRTYTEPGDRSGGSPGALHVPELILVLQGERPTAGGARIPLSSATSVELGRGADRPIDCRGARIRATIPDHSISREHARLVREHRQWFLEDLSSKNGTFVNGEAIDRHPLIDGDLIQVGATFFIFRVQLASSHGDGDQPMTGGFATFNRSLEAKLRRLERIARDDIPVLIQGETGTGKELVAREVHVRSGRSGKFVAVNCGAIPATLIESELFGSSKGAFSGAVQDRLGLIRHADGGTLFLDEVAELPKASQVALLRVLQERQVRPVGDTTEVDVDVRIVAATHQKLDQRVAEGLFREDLHARLAGFCIELAPLRERREDLGTLIAALLSRAAGAGATQLTIRSSAALALLRYRFPSNIRELEQALRVAATLVGAGPIAIGDLPPHFAIAQSSRSDDFTVADQDLRRRLAASLMETGGNIAATGRAFGKAPAQIRRWCRRIDLDIEAFRAK
jgi:hypothetical protein